MSLRSVNSAKADSMVDTGVSVGDTKRLSQRCTTIYCWPSTRCTRVDDQEVLLPSPVDVSRPRQQQPSDRVLPKRAPQNMRASRVGVE